MTIGIHRPTRLVIDRQALYDNIATEKARLKPNTDLFMVVKANGYGHGILQVAQTAVEAGATGFCVAILDEALQLRHAGFNQPILVLGITAPKYAALMAEYHVSATVGTLDWLQAAKRVLTASDEKQPLSVHLGLDTGMGRIGFQQPADLKVAVDTLAQSEQISFDGIFTHFSTADAADTDYFHQQVDRWQAFMAVLDKKPRYVHVSNSATSLWHDACNGNMIRFGVAAYGLNPSGTELKEPFTLKPAMSLTSELVFVKQLKAGRSVSYGATYTAKQDEWVGTLPIGYADGYERRLQGFHVLVDGQICEIIGRICMDQLMIRLPHEFAEGTTVTLVGKDHGAEITLQDVADYCGTIHYEIACGFTERIQRVYKNSDN
ncbi:alanine racemase [Secundilactobacillus collinoides]|uniref:Alanine racemase n=2 Tax=Secundilactobacillus collinoides TaxID=33960 RepID=A0A0R2B3Z1_SECCO|nr:alanine racemase [Secundilactobacillus collinoides]KRM73927.1 alanine racemase [Secundilactobacillus collinoides DSM 20515 = JCM 1123]KZL41686.1 alanine racemase [Secundilactobacillus collinoides]